MKSLKIQLEGGLGNQLFQLAAGRYFSLLVERPLVAILPGRADSKFAHEFEFKNFCNFDFKSRQFTSSGIGLIFWKVDRRFLHSMIFYRKLRSLFLSNSNEFIPNLPKQTRVLRGYFQAFEYAIPRQDEFRSYFTQVSFGREDQLVLKLSANPHISLHVRRGDYAQLKNIYGLLSGGYYLESLNHVYQITKVNKVMVFSDDIAAAKEMFGNSIFSEYEFVYAPQTLKPDQIISLMMLCQAHVIANSTFSWWGAFLAPESNLIVAPTPWLKSGEEAKSLIPPNWIQLPAKWE